jgi:hypothetical protein
MGLKARQWPQFHNLKPPASNGLAEMPDMRATHKPTLSSTLTERIGQGQATHDVTRPDLQRSISAQ